MGSKRTYNIAINELEPYITMPKLIQDDIKFVNVPRKSKRAPHGFDQWQSKYIVSLQNKDTIDNLILTLKSSIIYDERYHSFMLSYRYQGTLNIIHQMEVYPDDYLSHRHTDGKKIFGTHIHYLNTVSPCRPDGYSNFTWYQWFDYYKSTVNLTVIGQIVAPNDGELF